MPPKRAHRSFNLGAEDVSLLREKAAAEPAKGYGGGRAHTAQGKFAGETPLVSLGVNAALREAKSRARRPRYDGKKKPVSHLRRSGFLLRVTQPFRAGLAYAAPTALEDEDWDCGVNCGSMRHGRPLRHIDAKAHSQEWLCHQNDPTKFQPRGEGCIFAPGTGCGGRACTAKGKFAGETPAV